MVKQLFALIRDHVKIPVVSSLPATLARGGIAIDVASLYFFMHTRHTSLEDMKRDFKRMALFCLEREFPMIMVMSSFDKNREKTQGEDSSSDLKFSQRSKDANERQLKGIKTKLQKIQQEKTDLDEQFKQQDNYLECNNLLLAKLVVARDKEKRLKEQEKYLSHESNDSNESCASSIEEKFMSFFRENDIPFLEGEDKFLALMVKNKIRYIASEDNSHLATMTLYLDKTAGIFETSETSGISLIRNFVWHVRSPKKFPVQQYEVTKILQDMKVSSAQFLDMCFLLGFHGVPNIPGLGKKRIYTGVLKHQRLDRFLTVKNFVDKKSKDIYFKQIERIKMILNQDYENALQASFDALDIKHIFDSPLLVLQNIQKHDINKFRKGYRVVQVEYL